MLKRYQVLLTEWLAEYAQFVSEEFDVSFSESVRILMCIGAVQAIKELSPRYKTRMTVRNVVAAIKKEIAGFLEDRLQLKLKEKKSVVLRAENGMSFLGFRMFPCYRRLTGANVAKFVKHFKALRAGWLAKTVSFQEMKDSVRAWIAHAEHGNTWNLRTKLLWEQKF